MSAERRFYKRTVWDSLGFGPILCKSLTEGYCTQKRPRALASVETRAQEKSRRESLHIDRSIVCVLCKDLLRVLRA